MTVTVHQTGPGRYVVAVNECWIPGVYADEVTARRAADLPDHILDTLGRIYRYDGEDRTVTSTDLDELA